MITGLDGTGKSTLIRNLLQRGMDASVATIWDGMKKSPFKNREQIDAYLSTLSSRSRLLFLTHALVEALDRSHGHGRETLLFNGYYYKYFASELAHGADQGLVRDLSKLFPEPDSVLLLTLPPGECFHRKVSLSGYECGFRRPGRPSFVAFQEKTGEWLESYRGDRWSTLSSAASPGDLADRALKIIG